MTERSKIFLYSPPLLTEGGIFEVACDGRKFITKKDNILTLVDSISLAVIKEFGAYPEAEKVKFSPNSEYISFIDKKYPKTLIIINLNSDEVYSLQIDQHFSVEQISWSKNSEFIIFLSELNVYIGVYRIGKDVVILEGSVLDEYRRQLCCFNPDLDYFSLIRNDYLFSYCTETWEVHSAIKCPVSTVGIIYTDVYTIALWTSSGKFIVQSLLGERKFSMASSISSRIKAFDLCRERRVLAVATFDDKIELFDVFSWEKLYSYEYPLALDNNITLIWCENKISFQYSEKQLIIDNEFERKATLCLSTIKNINDEFKIKSNLKFRLKYSQGNKYLASFTPGFLNIVWIRSLKNKVIVGVISLNEQNIQGLRWHPTQEILAVLTSDSVIFWRESDTSVIYCKYLLTSFHWINTKLTICGIATEKECMLVYFRQRKLSMDGCP